MSRPLLLPLEAPRVPIPVQLGEFPCPALASRHDPAPLFGVVMQEIALEPLPQVWMVCTHCGGWNPAAAIRRSLLQFLRDPTEANETALIVNPTFTDEWLIPDPTQYTCPAEFCQLRRKLGEGDVFTRSSGGTLRLSNVVSVWQHGVECRVCHKYRQVPEQYPGKRDQWCCALYPFGRRPSDGDCCSVPDSMWGKDHGGKLRDAAAKAADKKGEKLDWLSPRALCSNVAMIQKFANARDALTLGSATPPGATNGVNKPGRPRRTNGRPRDDDEAALKAKRSRKEQHHVNNVKPPKRPPLEPPMSFPPPTPKLPVEKAGADEVVHWVQCDLCDKWRIVEEPVPPWTKSWQCADLGVRRGISVSCSVPEDTEADVGSPS